MLFHFLYAPTVKGQPIFTAPQPFVACIAPSQTAPSDWYVANISIVRGDRLGPVIPESGELFEPLVEAITNWLVSTKKDDITRAWQSRAPVAEAV